MVTPNYFHLLGIPVLRGRLLNDFDDSSGPQVAVIDEAFARACWPDENPLGKRFRHDRPDSPWITVVGVVANSRTGSVAKQDTPLVYVSLYSVNGASRCRWSASSRWLRCSSPPSEPMA